jgi:hypothetical protein
MTCAYEADASTHLTPLSPGENCGGLKNEPRIWTHMIPMGPAADILSESCSSGKSWQANNRLMSKAPTALKQPFTLFIPVHARVNSLNDREDIMHHP